ncbi:hypothetical protein L1999_24970 [Neobacillus drentensis]|uniref:hypothetical protein n=1 Tax=Neobacillus drentensis TaxID=220684 RepID=UPI001F34DCD9|nr:hypothetical protein [Neobacillus drentensis]ULT56262.1 hypothetical protein L1999_24970 [Neobacillus drentensis]
MYPYQSPYPVQDQRFIGLGWPLAIGGLSFLGGLLGGGLGASFAARPFYGGYGFGGYAGFGGYPGFGGPGFGGPGFGYPGFY